MIRSVVSKVMWVGRATVFLVGLAVILAMVVGVATVAMGAPANTFKLGQINTSNAVSTLVGAVSGSNLKIENTNNTDANATALALKVTQGKAPLTVNPEAGTATNLNADMVDGQEASSFASKEALESEANKKLWAVVNYDGTLVRGSGVSSSSGGSGGYEVTFNRDISSCAWVATLSGFFSQGETVVLQGNSPNTVAVATRDSAGALSAQPFHLIVLC